jgi:hypothetical protein
LAGTITRLFDRAAADARDSAACAAAIRPRHKDNRTISWRDQRGVKSGTAVEKKPTETENQSRGIKRVTQPLDLAMIFNFQPVFSESLPET